MKLDDTTHAPSQPVKSPNSCWRFLQGTYCPEELCHYQHGPPLVDRSSRRSSSSYGPSACLFFAQGYCRYGARCQFAHIPAPVPVAIITQPALSPSFVMPPTPPSPLPITPVANFHSGPKIHAPPVYRTEPEMDVDEDDIIQPHPLDEFPEEVEYVRESSQSLTPTVLPAYDSTLDGNVERDNIEFVVMATPATDVLDPSLYIIDEEVAALWEEIENAEDEGVQYVDTSRSRQVYDDKKVLVLSGGVMLGPPRSSSISSASSSTSASRIPSRLQTSFHDHEWSTPSSILSSSQPSSSTSSDFAFVSGSPSEPQTNRVDWSELDDYSLPHSDAQPQRSHSPSGNPVPQCIALPSHSNTPVSSETTSTSSSPRPKSRNTSFRCTRRQERRNENRARRDAVARDKALRALSANTSSSSSSSSTATARLKDSSRRHSLPLPVEKPKIDAMESSDFITPPPRSRSSSPLPQPRRRVPSI